MTEIKYSRKVRGIVKHINRDNMTLCGLDLEYLCSVSNYDTLPICKKCMTIKTISDGI